MSVRESEHPVLYARIQEQNLLRQYDLLTNCIEIGLEKGIESFDKYTLWSLNAAAVSNIAQFGGRFREQPIYVGNHIPPHFDKVPDLIDQFISTVHENWDISKHPTELPAYALWRLNWIHPFIEGNGRTARAACYYLMCVKYGSLLPGKKTVPERIRENRTPYYEALRKADQNWAAGQFNVRSPCVIPRHITWGPIKRSIGLVSKSSFGLTAKDPTLLATPPQMGKITCLCSSPFAEVKRMN